MVYGVSTIVGRFLTFMLTPLYTNYLSPAQIGDVAAIYSMIAFVNIAYSLGMESAFMRFWDSSTKDSKANANIFTTAFWSVALLGIGVTLITMFFAEQVATSRFLQLDGDGKGLVIIASVLPLLDALVLIPFARLRMMQKPRVFALIRLFTIVINVALNVLFVVYWKWEIYGVIWSGIIATSLTFLWFIPTLIRSAGSFTRDLCKQMLKFGLPTVPASFSAIMVQVADRPIMLQLTNSSVVGIYQTNFRLAIPMMLFVTVFEYAFKPFYLNHRNDPEIKAILSKTATIFTAVCGAIFLITAIGMPYIVQVPFVGGKFINPAFWGGLIIVPVVMFAYFFNGLFTNFAAGFHIQKKTSWFPIATGAAAIVSVGATWLLVPGYGMLGAAWAKVAAYLISAGVLFWAQKKVFPVNYNWGRIVLLVGVAAVCYAGVTYTQNYGYSEIASILVAAAVYGCIAWFVVRSK